MNRDMSRRKARAVAISASVEAHRKLFVLKAMGALALAYGIIEAALTVQHVFLAR